MSRPSISPALLAELVGAAPPRVVKRLDAAPSLAESWAWASAQAGLNVVTDTGETVELAGGAAVLERLEQLRCSCLLAPKCLHVLAVASVLGVASLQEPEATATVDCKQQAATATGAATAPLSPGQRQAIGLARKAAERLLATGANAAGTPGRAEVLRAVHAARAEGLFRLATACLALAEQVQALQVGSTAFELPRLCAQLAEVAAVVVQLERESVAMAWVGQARRAYRDVGHLQLHGLFCESVCEGGQSGAITWLCDAQGRLYRRADIQPGPAERIRQAYRHGTGLGDSSADHRQLCRSTVLLQGATASEDGRLGAGQGVRAAVVGRSSWTEGGAALRFAEPLALQLARAARADGEDRASGLLFFGAVILGVDGPALLLRADLGEDSAGLVVRAFGAADDKASRDGLRSLGCAPGLEIQCVARLRGQGRRGIQLLAVSTGVKAPPQWHGRANLGLDRLTTERVGASLTEPLVVEGGQEAPEPFEPIRRRLGQIALGGWSVLTPGVLAGMRAEAALLDALLARFAAKVLRAAAEVGPGERLRWFGVGWVSCETNARLAASCGA